MSPRTEAKRRATTGRTKPAKRKPAAQKKKLSRLRKPDDMSLEAWQIELRRQFGREQEFQLRNVGSEPIFSDFEVTNPQTERTYRVAIRGAGLGENFCSCPDFAVNTLGTCKHVEFTLDRLGRRRGAKTALALGFRPIYSQVYLHYGAQREVIFRPGTECPQELATYARKYFDDHGRLKPEAFAEFHRFFKRVTAGGHECRCYEDALQFIAQVRDRQRLQQQVAKTFSGRGGSVAMKKLLKVSLYPYQKTGALFAAAAGRCLLADDMGLGKTIQAIAATEILAREAGIERVLIVAPTSLKHQWSQEIEKFSGRDAQVVEGLLPRRTAMYTEPSFYKITNYDVVHRDFAAIERWRPDLIILDEAQRIKNWKTRTAQSVKRLESEYAIVLTGTPLENRLEELHSIVEFVDRHRLGPMFRFLAEHQHVDETGRVVGYRNLKNISETLEPILLRRTKDSVLKELPERLEKRFFVPMTPQQMDHHEENRETVARIVQKWRRYGFLREADQRRMQIALQAMRMSCNSTYLLDRETDHGVKADEVVDLLAEIFEQPQAKVVVFSQWLRMHELVVRRLEERKWDHVLFHGGVPGPKRKGLVQRFKQDPACRLFLSTDAGGVGLNLQNASAVVNLDQPWNPAVLEQRIGRVHRLGQKNPVRVVHFIAKGTIEEGMLGLLKFKSALAGGVLDNGQDEVFLGGPRLKRFMESVEKATGGIAETQIVPSEPAIVEPARVESTLIEPARVESARVESALVESAVVEAGEAKAPTAPRPVAAEQAWNEVLTAGMSLVAKLGQALGTGQSSSESATRSGLPGGLSSGASGSLVTRDEQTGQSYLKLPMPEPETMQKIVELFGALMKGK